MNKTNSRMIVLFTILQFFYLLSSAAIFSYGSALFFDRGINIERVGTISSIETMCSFIGFIVIGAICNRIGKVRLPIIIFLISTIVIYSLLFFFTDSPFLALMYGTIGFIYDPVTALIDSWILKGNKESVKTFAKVRTVSLFVFAVFFIILSYLISNYSYIVCLIVVYISLPICIIAALFIKENNDNNESRKILEKEESIGFKNLIKYEIKYMGLFLIMVFFVGLCCTSLLTYVPIILSDINEDIFYQGLGLFLCYMGNCIFTLLQSRLVKIGVFIKSILSASVMIIGLLAISIFPSVSILLVANFLRGVADALIVVSMRQYVKEKIPENLRTFSHSMSSAFGASLSGTVGIFVSSRLYNIYGIKGMSFFCIAAGIISVIICLFMILLTKTKKQREEKTHDEKAVSEM